MIHKIVRTTSAGLTDSATVDTTVTLKWQVCEGVRKAHSCLRDNAYMTKAAAAHIPRVTVIHA